MKEGAKESAQTAFATKALVGRGEKAENEGSLLTPADRHCSARPPVGKERCSHSRVLCVYAPRRTTGAEKLALLAFGQRQFGFTKTADCLRSARLTFHDLNLLY